MFPTKAVRKLKYTVCSKTFFRKPCRLWDNVEKYDRARRTRDGSIIRCKIGVICMLGSWDKNTDTYLLLLTSVRNISQFDNGTRGTPNTLILFTATSTTVTIKRERIVAFHGNNGYAMHHNVRLYVVPIWLVLKKMRSVWGEWDHKAPSTYSNKQQITLDTDPWSQGPPSGDTHPVTVPNVKEQRANQQRRFRKPENWQSTERSNRPSHTGRR